MSITDQFASYSSDLTGPIIGGFDVTPDDGNDLPSLPRALMASTDGDVAVVLKDGTSLILPALGAGVIYPIRAARIMATGTTATGIKGLY